MGQLDELELHDEDELDEHDDELDPEHDELELEHDELDPEHEDELDQSVPEWS